MQRKYAIVPLMALAATMLSGDSRPDRAGAVQLSAITAGTMPSGAAGQVISVDPATGKLRAPQAADLVEILGNAVSTSDEGLTVEKSPVAGGGMMVNLQGRFQNALTATVDANGNVQAPCVSGSLRDAAGRDGEVR
jgi:hypothetical protein